MKANFRLPMPGLRPPLARRQPGASNPPAAGGAKPVRRVVATTGAKRATAASAPLPPAPAPGAAREVPVELSAEFVGRVMVGGDVRDTARPGPTARAHRRGSMPRPWRCVSGSLRWTPRTVPRCSICPC